MVKFKLFVLCLLSLLNCFCSPPTKPEDVKNYFWMNRVKKEFATPFKSRLDKHIDLFIPTSTWNKLNADLPESGRQNFLPATLKYKEKILEVDIRMRGRQQIHWARLKRSYRIKIRGNYVVDGKKAFDIVTPKTFFPMEPISLALANEFGLYAPKIEYISYSVNNRFMGLGFLTEPIDNEFLDSRQLRGSVYAVDPESGRTKWNESPAWEDPQHWQRVCGPPDLSKVKAVVDDLLKEKLSIPYNLETWARFLLFLSLTGNFNLDAVANTRVFYGKEIFPVVWDVFYWTKTDNEVLLDVTTPIMRKLIQQSEFQETFWEQAKLLLPKFPPSLINKMIDETSNRIRPVENSSAYSTALSFYSFLHPTNYEISPFYLYDSSMREFDLSRESMKQAYKDNYSKIEKWVLERPTLKVVTSSRLQKAYAPQSRPFTIGIKEPEVIGVPKGKVWELIVKQK